VFSAPCIDLELPIGGSYVGEEQFVIDSSIVAMLRSPYTKRSFFAIYGAILVFLLVLLGVLTASLEAGSAWRDASTNFLGNFAATVAIFLVTYGFFVFITPSGLRNAKVLPLRSAEIADGLVDLVNDASDYWFWGRSGSYFRAVVLPRLTELARRDRQHVTVRIVLPDPAEPRNARRYAAIKHGLGETADQNTLAANVVATVVAAAAASAQNPYLHVRIGLCATVPALRYDLATSGGLITRDARSLPAILVNAGNPYFEMFRDAVENEFAQSREVTWDDNATILHESGDVSVADALKVVIGLTVKDSAIITAASSLLASKTHRYA
jgi:hypothetical protein